MEKKFLILSFIPFMVGNGIAMQKNHGGVAVDSYPQHHLMMHKDIQNESHKDFISDITEKYHTKNPFDLDEISDKKFSEGKFEEAADLTIAAAIYGLSDSQAFLADIDRESLKYITSKTPQSAQSISYYNSKLRGLVRDHFIEQSKD